jgi:hypothetical protein
VRLRAASRFARAAALSALEELAAGSGPIARSAMRAAAIHADNMAHDLTWVEADRVAAAIGNWPEEQERDAALARLQARRQIASEADPDAIIADAAGLEPGYQRHLERARATLAGYAFESDPPPTHRELVLAEKCLRAISELRHEQWRVAELTTRDLLQELQRDATALPRVAWVVARLTVSSEAKNVALTGLELIARLLQVAPFAPLDGFLPYAGAARKWRASHLTEALLRRAEKRGEPEARALLASELVRHARAAASGNERSTALSLLREAKSLAAP